jgi:hypothetical protein
MDPHVGKAALTLGLFIIIPSLILLPFQPRGSAEFVITALALAIGLAFLAVVAFVVRRTMR